MPSDLTPAEQAAAEALHRIDEASGDYEGPAWTVEHFAHEARAVVGAVRPAIVAVALESAADDLQHRLKTAPDAATGLLRVGAFLGDLRKQASALRAAECQAEEATDAEDR